MTPTQWVALMMFAAGAWQLWLFLARPDDYYRLQRERDERIKGVTNAGVALVKWLTGR
jgi:hypothetical protein